MLLALYGWIISLRIHWLETQQLASVGVNCFFDLFPRYLISETVIKHQWRDPLVLRRYPYFGDARDDDCTLLHRGLELLLSGLVELSYGGLGHGVGAIEHQQLGVRGGQGLADGGPHHRRLLRHAALRQLRLGGHRFLGRIWFGTKLVSWTASWEQYKLLC